MKKIIDGKMYDTETAESVGEWSNGYYPNDFYRMEAELFRKKSGEFFLRVAGGPLSEYGSQNGSNRGWGENIFPVSYGEAKYWAERKLSASEYVRIFGKVGE